MGGYKVLKAFINLSLKGSKSKGSKLKGALKYYPTKYKLLQSKNTHRDG